MKTDVLKKRMKVATIIKNAREAKNISQQRLGDLSGCSRSTIIRIETGVFSPNADQLYAIIESLGLKIKIKSVEI